MVIIHSDANQINQQADQSHDKTKIINQSAESKSVAIEANESHDKSEIVDQSSEGKPQVSTTGKGNNQTNIINQSSKSKSKVITADEINSWSSWRQTYYLTKTMPKELVSLWITSTLGWLSFTAFMIFYTNFVGESIYHGNPMAPKNSTAFANYRQGVRNASWGLMAFTIVSAIYSLLLIRLAKYFGK